MQPKKLFIGKIPCVIWTPNSYDSKKTYSWVVALSGQGEMGDGSDAQLTSKIVNGGNFSNLLLFAEKLGFIVVMPQLVQALNNWIPGYTSDYVNKAIDYTMDNYLVDHDRMYLTGLSLGGGGVWEYITSTLENANRVAAAIPICGTPIDGGDFSLVAQTNMAVWGFHAADDPKIGVAATRNQISFLNKFNPAPIPKYTEYPTGGHSIWGQVYNESSVYTWMLAQVNTNIVVPTPPPVVFKPTHKIVKQDGSSELVRIETL